MSILLLISFNFFEKMDELRRLQINDVIIDVGFGFGKTISIIFNYSKNFITFKHSNLPLLAGVSKVHAL